MNGVSLHRRDFCGLLASALAASSMPAVAQSESKAELPPIIDTHQHLWDLSRFKLPWLADYEPLRRSYLLDDYWKAAAGTGIVKTVYMEVDVTPSQRQAEVDYVVALARRPESRMVAAVVGGQPESREFGAYVRGLKAAVPETTGAVKSGRVKTGLVKGVRAALRGSGADADFQLDRDFVAGVRLLGDSGLSFDINVSPDQLPRAAALIDAAPAVRYVLDHCGNVDPAAAAAGILRWKRAIAEVAKRKQVVCKISGFITNSKGKRPSLEQIATVVDHVCECFGPDRVMFAGDWPVCTLAMSLADWVASLKQVVAASSAAEQQKLFHDNAARFYRV